MKANFLASDIPQMDQTPIEHELAASQDWLVKLRWIAGLGVLIATWIAKNMLKLGLNSVPLYAIGVCILIYNAGFCWGLACWQRPPRATRISAQTLARWQIAIDWVAMALLIHFSGGIESPALWYFFLHIILAAILLPARDTYRFAALATLLVSGTAGLEYAEVIPHIHIAQLMPVTVYQNPIYIGGILFFFTSAIFVSAYLATRTTDHLRKQEEARLLLGKTLQQTNERLQTLYENAQTVSSTLELQEVLDRLTRSVTEVMKVKACSIRMLDNRGRQLCLASTYGLSEEYLQKGCLLVDQNPLVREVLNGTPVAVSDITQDNRLQYPAEALAEGIRATLTVPLLGHEGPLGILRVYQDRVYTFTASDHAFLSAAANHGSIAIENALAYQSIQNLEESKRKFILTVTHELRSPVGVVRSLLRTLAGGYTGSLSDLQQDMLERALRRADFLQTLIDDLLDLAASKTGLRIEQKPEAVDLVAVLRKVIERHAIPAKEKRIALQLQMPKDDSVLNVWATPEELDRVFNNLVSNAIKYTPENGTVTARLTSDAGLAQVVVADTGIGIPEESLPYLFAEFYRAPNAKAQVKEGTGLGLVVVKEIVTRYGGYVQVDSIPGQGTMFTVTLPLWKITQYHLNKKGEK
ncbi:MAG: HAMP domain-containing histidine kinase [Anaerolineae bacterium]|nr:HAMP domain-containing histidine kinase [Anaerolineae bacterium]